MKRIGFYVNELIFGSLTTQVIDLANSLSDLYKVEIVYLKNVDYKEYINKKIEFKKILYKDFVLDFKNKKFYKELLSTMSAYDIVIFNDEKFLEFADKLCFDDKIFIYWMHDFIENMKNVRKLNFFDRVVVPNEKVLSELSLKNGIFLPDSIFIKKNKISYKNNKKIIFVGKLKKRNRIDKLLEFFNYVVDVKKDVVLSIVGEGIERNDLLSLIKSKGLEDNVNVLGVLEREELMDELLDSCVFVSTSSDNMFNLSVLEAMSVGLPVVSLKNDSISFLINDEIDGFLIDDDDIFEMSKCVISLLDDENLRISIGECAIEKSLNFDINVIKREWIKLFK